MEWGETAFFALKSFLLISGFAIAGVGLLLSIAPASYQKLEEVLNEDAGGIRKRIFPHLESNRDVLHKWLITHPRVSGVALLAIGVIFYFVADRLIA
jgi:hypothetical protein